MKRFPSIRSNSDFQICYQQGKSYANKLLIMYCRRTQRSYNRIGISASKKIGNSVVRHRIIRRLREIFRLHMEDVLQGHELVIVVRKGAEAAEYKQLESAYLHLCRLHKI